MTIRGFLLAAVAVAIVPAVASADGDRFYHATWYAGSSPSLAWSGRSVLAWDDPVVPMTLPGSIGPTSPRYFRPGYGYLSQQRGFSGLSGYGTVYAFGMRQPSDIPFSLFDSRNSSLIPGTLHQPWYLPGSPGNYQPLDPAGRLYQP